MYHTPNYWTRQERQARWLRALYPAILALFVLSVVVWAKWPKAGAKDKPSSALAVVTVGPWAKHPVGPGYYLICRANQPPQTGLVWLDCKDAKEERKPE